MLEETQIKADEFVVTNKPLPLSIIEAVEPETAYNFFTTSDGTAVPCNTFFFNPFKSTFNNEADAVAEYNAQTTDDGFLTYEAIVGLDTTPTIFILEIRGGKVYNAIPNAVRQITGLELSCSSRDEASIKEAVITVNDVLVMPQVWFYRAAIVVPLKEQSSSLEEIVVHGTQHNDKSIPLAFTFNAREIMAKINSSTSGRVYFYAKMVTGAGVKMYCRATCTLTDDNLSLYLYTYGRVKRSKYYGIMNKCEGVYYGNL